MTFNVIEATLQDRTCMCQAASKSPTRNLALVTATCCGLPEYSVSSDVKSFESGINTYCLLCDIVNMQSAAGDLVAREAASCLGLGRDATALTPLGVGYRSKIHWSRVQEKGSASLVQ